MPHQLLLLGGVSGPCAAGQVLGCICFDIVELSCNVDLTLLV